MRRIVFCLIILASVSGSRMSAQDQPINPSLIKTGVYHGLSQALKDLPVLTDEEFQQLVIKGEQKILNKK